MKFPKLEIVVLSISSLFFSGCSGQKVHDYGDVERLDALARDMMKEQFAENSDARKYNKNFDKVFFRPYSSLDLEDEGWKVNVQLIDKKPFANSKEEIGEEDFISIYASRKLKDGIQFVSISDSGINGLLGEGDALSYTHRNGETRELYVRRSALTKELLSREKSKPLRNTIADGIYEMTLRCIAWERCVYSIPPDK